MESILKTIASSWGESVLATLLLTVIILAYIFKDSIAKLIYKKSNFNYSIQDLEMHDLFTELQHYKNFTHVFKSYHVVDETKTKVFKDFLDIKMQGTSDNLKAICKIADKSMKRAELKHLILEHFNYCNVCLEKNLKQRFLEKGLALETAQTIIDKFFHVRQSTMDKYERRIESVFACDFYETNFQLILAVYEMVTFEIDEIVNQIIRAFESANGMFFELEYK
jgi:hypothetical protein